MPVWITTGVCHTVPSDYFKWSVLTKYKNLLVVLGKLQLISISSLPKRQVGVYSTTKSYHTLLSRLLSEMEKWILSVPCILSDFRLLLCSSQPPTTATHPAFLTYFADDQDEYLHKTASSLTIKGITGDEGT